MAIPRPGAVVQVATLKMEKLTIKELISFMNKNGLSHKEFAEILGVTIQAVNLWLDGKRDVSVTNTRLIRMMQKYPTLLREFGKC